MAYFYCKEHEIAYENFNQFNGHWRSNHHDIPLPKSEDVSVDELPSTATLKPLSSSAAKPRRRPRKVGSSSQSPTGEDLQTELRQPSPDEEEWDEEPEEEPDPEVARLDRALTGIGVPSATRRVVLAGFQTFSLVREHPTNLANFLTNSLDKRFHSLLPMVIHEMFPRREREDFKPSFIFDDYGRRPGYPPAARYYEDSPYYREPRRWEYYDRPYPESYGPGPAKEPDPLVTALQEQNKAILEQLKESRENAAKERQERLEEQKQAQIDAQFKELKGELGQLAQNLAGVVSLIRDETAKDRQAGEASASEGLRTEIAGLRSKLESEKDSRFEGSLEALREDKSRLETRFEALQNAVAAGNGKTTEDLLSQAVPLAFEKLDSVGNTLKSELAGIREAVTEGKGPAVAFPRAKSQDSGAGVIQDAQKIAQARGLEGEILTLAGQAS